jgi:tetratricopeptide (TPR) repeat protein
MGSASHRPKRWMAGGLVGLVAATIHGRSAAFDFTYLDDRDLIVDDSAFLLRPLSVLRAFARPYMSVVDGQHPYYRPLVTASYVLDAQWSGARPFGYHLTNVALHTTASILVYALLRQFGFGALVTLLAALVFAVHPALAAAVAWIPGRNDSLLAVFALAAWLFFLRDAVRRSALYRILHLAFFWLSLLTKESALALPLVCSVHLALVEPATFARFRRSHAALFVVGGWSAGIAARLLAHPVSGTATAAEFFGKLPSLFTSLGQLVLPANPSLVTVQEDLPLWPGVLAAGLIAAAVCFIPGVRPRVVGAGAATFALFLFPALFVPGTLIQSSRLYLPAMGFLVCVGEIARAVAERDRALLLSGFATTVAALAVETLAYEGTLRDRRAFARSAVDAAPHSALAHFCLGQSYQIDGAADGALAEYRLALRLGATYVVHNNIGVIYMANARWTDAERELREELAIDPHYARAYRNLAVVLRHEGRGEESRQAEEQADRLGR